MTTKTAPTWDDVVKVIVDCADPIGVVMWDGALETIKAHRDAAIREAIEAEREACAKLCESKGNGWWIQDKVDQTYTANSLAAAIRARQS